MPVICPKCSHVRPENATNPAWECPACGICYARFGDRAAEKARPAASVDTRPGWNPGLVLKVLLVVALGWGISAAFKHRKETPPVAEAMAASPQPADAGRAEADAVIAISGADASLLHSLAGRLEKACARNKYGLSEDACIALLRERENVCANRTAQRFPGQIGDTSRMEVVGKAYVGCIFEEK